MAVIIAIGKGGGWCLYTHLEGLHSGLARGLRRSSHSLLKLLLRIGRDELVPGAYLSQKMVLLELLTLLQLLVDLLLPHLV